MKATSAAKLLIPLVVLLLIGDAFAYFNVSGDKDKTEIATRDDGRSDEPGADTKTTQEASPQGGPSSPVKQSGSATKTQAPKASGGSNQGTPRSDGSVLPGTYIYETKATSPQGTQSEDAEWVVKDVSRGPGEVRQTVTGALIPGSEPTTHLTVTRPTNSSILETGDDEDKCVWQPELVQYVFPLTSGQTWKADSKCTVSSEAGQFKLHFVEQAKVIGTTKCSIDGADFQCWTVNRAAVLTITNTQTGAEQGRQEQDSTEKYLHKYAMVLETSGDISISGPANADEPFILHVEARLKTLRPSKPH